MIAIQCKNGKTFAACVEKYVDAEWKLQENYYLAQGCKIVKQGIVQFDGCKREHCETLEHKFEELISEVKNS